jgi:hypothetical protein
MHWPAITAAVLLLHASAYVDMLLRCVRSVF